MTEILLPASVVDDPKVTGISVTDSESGESVVSQRSIAWSSTMLGILGGFTAGISSLTITSSSFSFTWQALLLTLFLMVFGAVLGFLGGTLLGAVFKMLAEEDKPLSVTGEHWISVRV